MRYSKRDDFCVFVISHGKPFNDTYEQLMLCKCEYPIYIVIDDMDSKKDEYIAKYGEDKVCIFSKKEYAKKCDMFDNFDFDKVIIFARNACYDFAKKLGYRYFIELDDDYNEFAFRFPGFKWIHMKRANITDIFTLYVNYYAEHDKIDILAFMQGSDITGIINGVPIRKAMNTLICSIDRRVIFNGRINEDVNAYTRGNQLGRIFISFPNVTIHQRASQTGNGMSKTYEMFGTYTKSFYSVIQCPSFVRISVLQSPTSYRIHHNISHRYGFAKILSSKYKK